MEFWKLAYERNWVDATILKKAVKTDKNFYGEITPAEYEEITGIEFVE